MPRFAVDTPMPTDTMAPLPPSGGSGVKAAKHVVAHLVVSLGAAAVEPRLGKAPTEVIALAMRQAVREGRRAEAESLSAVLIKIGEMIICLAAAREISTGDVDAVLADIAKAL